MADYALTNRYACVDERGQGKKTSSLGICSMLAWREVMVLNYEPIHKWFYVYISSASL